MSGQYTKIVCRREEVFQRKAAGDASREFGAHFGLRKVQIMHSKQIYNRIQKDKRIKRRSKAKQRANQAAVKFSARSRKAVKSKYRSNLALPQEIFPKQCAACLMSLTAAAMPGKTTEQAFKGALT